MATKKPAPSAKISVPTNSKQFTTAGTEIDLVAQDPGIRSGDTDSGRVSIELVVTSVVTDPSNLVITTVEGDDDTWEVTAASCPFYVPVQVWKIKSTATSGIKGNACYN